MAGISVKGWYDLHVHPGPEPYPRVGTSVDIARWCAAAGMAGIVAKCHFESSVARAHFANEATAAEYPQFKVYAAIVLNRGVGGINPLAVEWALDQGAKYVWMPTFDSTNHVKEYGSTGNYGSKNTSLGGKKPHAGYNLLDANGKLIPQAKEVVDMIIDYDACLATGHVSKEEIYALAEYAIPRKIKRMVVTHAQGRTPNLDVPTMIDLAKRGIYMEVVTAHALPFVPKLTLKQVIQNLRAVGADRFVMSSDSGHIIYARPPEAMRSVVQMLIERGLTEEEVQTICIKNPAYLLGVTDKQQ